MNPIIEQMLTPYQAQTLYDKENAIKEVVQEIILCGLSRSRGIHSEMHAINL